MQKMAGEVVSTYNNSESALRKSFTLLLSVLYTT